MGFSVEFSDVVGFIAGLWWGMLLLFIVGIPIYRWIETRRWVKSFMGLEDRSRAQSLGTYAKGVEIVAVLLAVIAFLYEFGYEKPRDRASINAQFLAQNAQLLAQIADLAYGEDKKIERNSSAIESIMILLTKEKFSMRGISIPKIELANAQLAHAILPFSNLSRANLRSAYLRSANLSSANLSGADLIDADLSGADLIDADLSGADLIDANLSGADLIDADLSGADLLGANLSGADLIDANLSGADLIDADLSGADLFGADLFGANLSGAYFSSVRDLTQSMLDGALPSPPPVNLPKGLEWPFERGQDGEWVRKEQSPAAE